MTIYLRHTPRSMIDGLVHEPMLSQLASVVSSSSQLKFAQTVSSKTAVAGGTVEFTLTKDLTVGGVVVAPTGGRSISESPNRRATKAN